MRIGGKGMLARQDCLKPEEATQDDNVPARTAGTYLQVSDRHLAQPIDIGSEGTPDRPLEENGNPNSPLMGAEIWHPEAVSLSESGL